MDYYKIKKGIMAVVPQMGAGHGLDHALRVTEMALCFARREGANEEIVMLAGMLHDVDDYKFFGVESEKNLTNATAILKNLGVLPDATEKVLSIIRKMGYSKSLKGIRPDTIEGMVVSDADMCDAIGAWGILRTYAYNSQHETPFFDKRIMPGQDDVKTAEIYRLKNEQHAIQHFFDKLLKINKILMTEAGREEGMKRQKIMVDFLEELFREEGAEEWSGYLKEFCAEL